MKTNEQISSTSVGRPHVPPPTPAKPKDYIAPSLADKTGMKKWSNDMLSGHPSDRATSFEEWGNSYVTRFQDCCGHDDWVIENQGGSLQ